MRKNLKPEDLGDFLELGNCAILATHFRDNRMLLSPVWFEWRDKGFTVILEVGDTKARQIERDPNVSIIVTEDALPYRSLEVRGKAQVISGDTAAVVHRMALRYLGPEQGPPYADAVNQRPALFVRIEPGDLRVWDFNDEQDVSGTTLPKAV